ncbi:MAG TPA: hypothetical protein ENL09_05930 [Bacteroidetes bacterium]|nr:hypothetical protein [Bacteroidota bacterium]
MVDREEIYEEFKELDNLPTKLGPDDAINRGRQFEKITLKLFQHEKLLTRKSYHTSDNKSEQIDGALNIDGIRALLEVKWVNSGLAASDLYAFLGKVEGKFTGTIGIFISREELSDNFLKSLKAGRRQSVIVIHGQDVDLLFKPDFPVAEYIKSIIDHVSYDNRYHLSAEEFLAKARRSKSRKKQVHKYLQRSLSDKDYTNIIYEWTETLNTKDAIKLLLQLLKIYLRLSEEGGISPTIRDNLKVLCEEAIKILPKKETRVDKYYFDELSINFTSSVLIDFIDCFSTRFEFLNTSFRDKFCKRLQKQWQKALGDYYSENTLSIITKHIWSWLNRETKDFLVKIFLSFIESGRRSNFPQMQLANKILRKSTPDETDALVRELLKENISYWIDEDVNEDDWKEKLPKWYARQYRKWEKYLNNSIENTISKVLEDLLKEKNVA